MIQQNFSLVRFSVVLCAISVLSSSQVNASEREKKPFPNYVEMHAEGWTFAPAIQDQNVFGFLAVVDESIAVGSNLRILWFERGKKSQWISYAWEQADLPSAASNLRNSFDASVLFQPSLSGDTELCLIEESTLMVDGLMADDLLLPTVFAVDDPASYLDVLASAGWPVAPSLSSLAVADPIKFQGRTINQLSALLDDLASDVEMALFGKTQINQTKAWPCKCKTTYGVPTCGPWTFVISCPGMGGSKVCHYSRICTRTWTNTGKYWYCFSCAGTGTQTYTEVGRTTALPGDPCVPPPP